MRHWSLSRAWVEHINPRAGDRPAGAFAFGGSRATVETVLACLAVPFRTITPATWKCAASIPAGKGMKGLALSRAVERFVAADMPNANRLTVGIMAMVAEAERDAISARTKAALAAKARWYAEASPEQLAALREQGKAIRLGGARPNSRQIHQQGAPAGLAARQANAAGRAVDLAPVIAELRAEGVTSLAGLATALTERGIPTSRGAERWSASQVSRLMRGVPNGP